MVVASTDAAAVVLPHLARRLTALHAQWTGVTTQVETLIQAHPLCQVLIPMLGTGARTAAIFLTETLDRTFSIGVRLAFYVGLIPITRRSGSSTRGEHASHGGNKRLKHVIFLPVLASLRPNLVSRAYYQRKRDQGKRHNQVAPVLVRRRILTLYAMIRDGVLYDSQSVTKLPATV